MVYILLREHSMQPAMELTKCNVAQRDVWHVPEVGCV